MEKSRLLQRVGKEIRSFFEEAGRASEPVYLVLLTLYVAVYYILRGTWSNQRADYYQ